MDWFKVSVVWWAFCTNLLIAGPLKIMGIYFLQFQLHLDASANETSVIFALLYSIYFFSGPIATLLCNSLGYRWTSFLGVLLAATGTSLSALSSSVEVVYATLSVFMGLGSCCAVAPVYAVVGQVFAKKRPLVNNIVIAGSAVASIPLSIVAQLWIDWYGWRGSVLLVSGVLLQSLVSSVLTFNMASRCDAEMFGKKRKLFDLSLLKSTSFLMFCVGCGFYYSALTVVSVFLVRFAQSRGVSDLLAAGLPGIMGAVDTILKPFTGYLLSLNKIGCCTVKRMLILSGSVAAQALTAFCLPFAYDYGGIVACMVVYAACIGLSGALPLTVLAELYGPEKLATSLGLRSLSMGAFTLAVPSLIGCYVEQTKNYSIPFFASGGVGFVAGLFFLLANVCADRNKKTTEISSISEKKGPTDEQPVLLEEAEPEKI